MRGRRKLFLELTPLLDVILIMMFFILMQNAQLTDKKQAEADKRIDDMRESMSEAAESVDELESSYSKEITGLKESLELAKDQLGSFEQFKEYCQIITVCVINKADGSRVITLTDGEAVKETVFDWDSLLYAKNSLRSELGELLKKQEEYPAFIVFHYDDSVIYKRDYELVAEVLGEISQEKRDVYVRYSEERE